MREIILPDKGGSQPGFGITPILGLLKDYEIIILGDREERKR